MRRPPGAGIPDLAAQEGAQDGGQAKRDVGQPDLRVSQSVLAFHLDLMTQISTTNTNNTTCQSRMHACSCRLCG